VRLQKPSNVKGPQSIASRCRKDRPGRRMGSSYWGQVRYAYAANGRRARWLGVHGTPYANTEVIDSRSSFIDSKTVQHCEYGFYGRVAAFLFSLKDPLGDSHLFMAFRKLEVSGGRGMTGRRTTSFWKGVSRFVFGVHRCRAVGFVSEESAWETRESAWAKAHPTRHSRYERRDTRYEPPVTSDRRSAWATSCPSYRFRSRCERRATGHG